MEYKSYFRPEEFSPESAPDFASNVQSQMQKYIDSLENQSRSMADNAEINIKNLQNYNKSTIDFLSKTSKTAADFLKGQAIREAEKTKADAINQAEMDFLEGKSRSPEFGQRLNNLSEQDDQANAAAGALQGDDASRQGAVFPLYSNTAWKQAMYTRAMARKLIKTRMGTFIAKHLDETNPQTSSERAKQIAIAKAEFYRLTGLSNLSPDFMQDLFPDINKITSKINAKYEVAETESNAEQQRIRDLDVLTDTGNLTKFLNSNRNSVKNGKVIGFGGAWDNFVEAAPMLLFSEKMPIAVYENIKRSVIPANAPGAGKTYGEFYKDRFAKIESKWFDLTRKRNEEEDYIEKEERAQLEKDFVAEAERLQAAGIFTEAARERLQSEFKTRTGGYESRLLANLASETITAKDIAAQEEQAEKRAASNALTLNYARTLHPSIREKFVKIAERQERLRKESQNLSSSKAVIRQFLAEKPDIKFNTIGDGFDDYTVERYYNQKLIDLNRAAASIAAANPGMSPEEVAQKAESLILDQINRDLENPKIFDAEGDGLFVEYRAKGATAKYEQQIQKLAQLKQVIERNLDKEKQKILFNKEDKTFTKQEMETLQGSSLGIKTNYKIRTIAQSLGMDPVDLVIQLRKKFGLEPFPAEAQRQQIRDGLSPALESFFSRYKTPESSMRLLHSVNQGGTYNQDLVPDNKATIMKQYATTDLTEPVLTGVVEVLGFNESTEAEVANLSEEITQLISEKGSLGAALDELGKRRNIPKLREQVMRNAVKYGGELPTRGAFSVEIN